MFSSNYSENRHSLFGVESDIELFLLTYALHGNKEKTLRQLYGLRLHYHNNPKAIRVIDKAIERFNKLKSFRFL